MGTVARSTPPAGSQEIAQLESASAVGFGTQGQTDAAVMRLKREAAALGANGVILMGVGSSGSPVGMSVGAGSYGSHVGGGVGIPPMVFLAESLKTLPAAERVQHDALWRERLVIGGRAAPALWPVLWATWQWRGARLRSLARTWAHDPELAGGAADDAAEDAR